VILFVTVTNKDFFKSNKGTENNINNSIEVVASKDFLAFGDSIPCSYRLGKSGFENKTSHYAPSLSQT
jgi:hypothetical protein